MIKKLAIVIPAYKRIFLEETLGSISRQTNKDFNLYIGDDNSPEALQPVVDAFAGELNIVYKRFDNNLGGTDLVGHWNRCVALTTNEEWVWLFSDDDKMPDDAVERFLGFIETRANINLVRFDVEIIDRNSMPVLQNEPHPEWESSLSFVKKRFKGLTYSFVVEYIFKKDLYEQKGGFVSFPAAWASDDASWALFGLESGIYTIPGNPVSWRQSGLNISSEKVKYSKLKIIASIKYIVFINKLDLKIETHLQTHWLNNQFKNLIPTKKLKHFFGKSIITNEDLPFKFKILFLLTFLKSEIQKLYT
jgi:glycosyltransferase involved in cell wall biosynthesis